LECTLEELYLGCIKTLRFERKVLNSDNRTTFLKEEEVEVEVHKGASKGTKFNFPLLGNEGLGLKTCIFYRLLIK